MKEGWEVKKLGEVSVFYNGYTPKETELFDSGIIPYFKVSDMNHPMNKKFLVHTDLFLNESNKIYPRNTIVFPKNGAAIATNKKRILERESVVDLNTGGIGVKDNCLYYLFLYYYLNNIDFKKYTRRGAVPTLDLKELKSLSIYLPPLPEQSRIVEELDLLSNIIEKKRQQLSELDNLAQSIFYDMFGDPVTNEKGWEVKLIGEISTFYNGKAHEKNIVEDSGFLLVNAKFISSCGDIKKYSDKQLFPLYKNDITMVMSDLPNGKTLAKCYLIEKDDTYTLNQRICAFRGYKQNPIFLKYVLNRNKYYLSFDDGNGQTNLRKSDVVNCPIILPPLSLQQLFALKIEAIEKQKALIKQSIAETEELFNSRMDYYFS